MNKSEVAALVAAGKAHETFQSVDLPYSVDITQLRLMIMENPKRWPLSTVLLNPEVVDFLLEQREIDMGRVAELTPSQIEEPGIATPLPESKGGGVCPIDGHHRAIRRFAESMRAIDMYLVPIKDLPPVAATAIEFEWGGKQIDSTAKSWKTT